MNAPSHAPARPHAIHAASARILACGLALLLAVGAGGLALLWHAQAQLELRERQQLALLARLAQAHASAVLEASERTLDQLATDLVQAPDAWSSLQAVQYQALRGQPALRGLALVDMQGLVLATTAPADLGRRIDLRPLLAQPLQDGRTTLTASSADHLTLVRRVRLAPQAYALLIAQLDPGAFAPPPALLEASAPGTQVLLARPDGSLLAQAGAAALPPGGSLHGHALFAPYLAAQPAAAQGVAEIPGPTAVQWVAWQSAPAHPVVALAAQPGAQRLQRWLAAQRQPLAGLGAGLALLALAIAIAWRSARRRPMAQPAPGAWQEPPPAPPAPPQAAAPEPPAPALPAPAAPAPPATVDVRDLLEDLAAELSPQLERKRLPLKLQLGAAPLPLAAPAEPLAQALRQVLAHAIASAPKGQTLRIAADADAPQALHIAIHTHGPATGPTAHAQALREADQALQAQGGSIDAAGDAEGGTVFHVRLPGAAAD
ncbi:hypothetical protein YS110_18550 [Acidovorax sp. YS12]|nr:hypothetical protein YS110_18550 [Acidovorax sp. YS12]